MPKLIATRGLPASGKTTWAKSWVSESPTERHRLNKDDFRDMLNDSVFVKGVTEGAMLAARDAALTALLKQGISVVCDDTNLPADSLKRLVKISNKMNIDFEVKDFTDVSLEECIKRDGIRDYSEGCVGHLVIERMYRNYLVGKNLPLSVPNSYSFKIEPYMVKPGLNLPPAIIVDLDGTICLHNGRSPYDESKVAEDLPNKPVIAAVLSMIEVGYQPIFMSGRTDKCFDDSASWILKHLRISIPEDGELYMRRTGDRRPDNLVKYELFNNHVRNQFDVRVCFDDRNQVVDMYRALGLTVLQVNEGDF